MGPVSSHLPCSEPTCARENAGVKSDRLCFPDPIGTERLHLAVHVSALRIAARGPARPHFGARAFCRNRTRATGARTHQALELGRARIEFTVADGISNRHGQCDFRRGSPCASSASRSSSLETGS